MTERQQMNINSKMFKNCNPTSCHNLLAQRELFNPTKSLRVVKLVLKLIKLVIKLIKLNSFFLVVKLILFVWCRPFSIRPPPSLHPPSVSAVFPRTTWLLCHALQPCRLFGLCVTDRRHSPTPRAKLILTCQNLCGSNTFAWACIHKLSLGFYPNAVWSLRRASQRNELLSQITWATRQPTDSWLASPRHITNPQRSGADRCLFSVHLAAVPEDLH